MPSGSWCWAVLVLLGHLDLCLMKLVPRVSFPVGKHNRSVTHFSSPDVGNTTTLLLSNDSETLYVGARDAVLVLDVSQPGVMKMKSKFDWSPSSTDLSECSAKGKRKTDCPNFVRVLTFLNTTHMYVCGTHAFNPRCTYVEVENFVLKPHEGRSRCPYDPYQKNTAIVVDGELYTGTVADYRGNRPVISRHLSQGSRSDLKLDDTLGWLEDPTFISSAFLPSEDKVYFFFSEVGREYDFIDKFIVSRVAQVCTSDVGGQRTLQRRWTTFAKAQLLCQAEIELPYNVLQDIVTLPPPEGAAVDETLFYGIFTSQWSANSGQSAVCAFQLRDVKAAFAGNYKVLNRDTLRWGMRVQEKVATPGQCGLHNANDNVLRFVKDNFLTDQSVFPVGRSLTLVSPDNRYTNIAAQRVPAANGKSYVVLYLLTESGFLHKTVLSQNGPHIIEEVQVFQGPQSVKNILLSVTKGVVFVGSSKGVTQVPVSSCFFYQSCAECVLARDPFCAWEASSSACVRVSVGSHRLNQDVDGGNVTHVCGVPTPVPRSRSGQRGPPAVSCHPGQQLSVSLNEVVTLPCAETSRLSTLHWERPGVGGALSSRLYLHLSDGSLQFLATPATLGCYICYAIENSYRQTRASYMVTQREVSRMTTLLPLLTTPGMRPTGGRLTTKEAELRTSKAAPRTRGAGLTTTLEVMGSTGQVGDQGSPQEDSNLTSVREPRLTDTSSHGYGGDQLSLGNGRTYYRELVTVSVLLSLTLFMLLVTALYAMHPRARSHLGPRVCPGAGSDMGVGQERDPLSGSEPPVSVVKQNGLAQSKQVSTSNRSLRSSNGHLPNTPI